METYHYYFIIGAVILCTAPVLLLALAHVESDESGDSGKDLDFNSSRDIWRQLREENTHIASLSQLLRRAGLISSAAQLNTIVATLAVCALIGCGIAFNLFVKDASLEKVLTYGTFGFLVSGFLAYRILKGRAEERQDKLDRETMMLVQTTRMLWRVGLSLPKTLAIICEELHDLSPICSQELTLAVNKIESGRSQEEALYELIEANSAEGFKEYLIVIRQQSITGGSIDKSLDELYKLLQNRRRLELQEEVNKMSGKMSLVMMLFLFPAMLIASAGPAFLTLIEALGSLGN